MRLKTDKEIRLNKNASVVELAAARNILYQVGYKCRSDGQHLKLFYSEEDDYVFFANKARYNNKSGNEDREVGNLYIDEGNFTDTMDITGKTRHANPWEELVDFRELLGLVYSRVYPEGEHPRSEAMGRGRYQNDLIAGYIRLLADVEWITWVE